MNGTIYGESTSDLLDYPRVRMAVRVGDCDAKLQVVGDLDGQTFPLGSGEVMFNYSVPGKLPISRRGRSLTTTSPMPRLSRCPRRARR